MRASLKKKLLFLIFVVLILAASLLLILSINVIRADSIVAYIDGEPVIVRELTQAMLKKRSDIYAYFYTKYNASDSPDFWTENYGGENPLEKIKRDALAEVAGLKVQQMLAKEKGIVDDISYKKFLKDLKNENKRRLRAVENNEVIYGPVKYSEEMYFNILFNKMITDLKNKLKNETAFEEEKIKEIYKSNIHNYKLDDTIVTDRIIVDYSADQRFMNEAEAVINNIRERLENGADLENIISSLSVTSPIVMEIKKQTFEPETAKSDYMLWPDLVAEAMTLTEGQISKVINLNGTFNIIRCVERIEGETIPFDDAKDSIINQLVEEQYNSLVEERLKNVQITINENVYGKISEKYLR